MDVPIILNKILTNDTFANEQTDLILSYYQLKHTTRWDSPRTEDETESVAEHIFGMHILIDYFYPLLKNDFNINLEKSRHLATWHDMAEAFVGDMTTATKTKEHEHKEKIAEADIVKTAPGHLVEMLTNVYSTYDERKTIDAKFIKALDKIEPCFHMIFITQKNKSCHKLFTPDWTPTKYREYRHTYISMFPIIKRFDDILENRLNKHLNE